ncbi:Bor family protein [Namhaeicola litoreus]|uniref:Bor family protein n=1 Tax=Namhaeicola litoreus TaxID=1052145 RepID=A0ABW3XYM6_9FLAO
MIKRTLKMAVMLMATGILFTSCYSYTTVVGEGAKGNDKTTKWNHYLIGGLAPIDVSNPKDLAGGAEDYNVKTELSFVNGLVSVLTFGIYSPTTTTVTK